MKKPLFDLRWIRIGFNLGVGIFLAVAVCYSIVIFGTTSILAIIGIAKIAGPGFFTFTVSIIAVVGILLVLVLIPAFIGRTAAQVINYFRFPKQPSLPTVPEKHG